MNTVVPAVPTESRPSKAWSASLWVAQVLLAVAFAMAGFMKATLPIPELAAQMNWPDLPGAFVRFIGAAELTAVVGLILPAATRIKPILTPLAAVGLILLMVSASVFHGMRGEIEALPITFGLGAAAAFVAWGRFRKAPIRPR